MVRLLYIILLIAMAACSAQKAATSEHEPTSEPETTQVVSMRVPNHGYSALPKAVIYKMNGDYADLVPITLDPSRQRVQSYPAPTDLTAESTPLPMGNGWYLDRRGGVGMNTAFLKYTYPEYMALQSAPSPSQLMADIVPEARVTQVQALPMTLNEALADTAAVKQYAL